MMRIGHHHLPSDESTDLDRMMRDDLHRQLFGYPVEVPLWTDGDEDADEVDEASADAEIQAYRCHFYEVFWEEFDRLIA